MKIAVLSGKGGVGKSSITASLSVLLAEKYKIVAVDCDIDAPNLGLCFGKTENDFEKEFVKTSEIAKFVKSKFSENMKCVDVCEFSAISFEKGHVKIDPFLCEGCGTCQIVCPNDTIKIEKVQNGWIGVAHSKFPIISGQLEIGQAGSGEIVNLVKEKAESFEPDIMLIDSSAGIGCPVISSIKGSDFVVAVTEPTPSALSDLKRALEVVNHFEIPHGLIINKTDINSEFTKIVEDFVKSANIPILGKIPYDIDFVNALVNLEPPVTYNSKFRPLFEGIVSKILKITQFKS